MSTRNQSSADLQLRDNVLWQLDWDPAVDASGIGVSAIDGTVTLTGYIDTHAGKRAAARTSMPDVAFAPWLTRSRYDRCSIGRTRTSRPTSFTP